MDLFSINNILFSIGEYNVCFLELIGVIVSFIAIFLASMNNVWTFIIGLLSCGAYFGIFYQQHLYCMMSLQVVFFCIDIYGIINWLHPTQGKKQTITQMKLSTFCILSVITIAVGVACGFGMKALGAAFPDVMPLSDYPISDAVIMVANIVGQVMLARHNICNWWIWVLIDIFSVVIWTLMGMWFTAVLYVAYLAVSVNALYTWNKEIKTKQ